MVYKFAGDQDEGDLLTGTRVCRTCGSRKAMGEFHFANGGRHRRRRCKPCVELRASEVRALAPRKYAKAQRARAIRRKYGLDLDMYEQMLQEQRYRCLICWDRLTAATTHVDHDHRSGAVRRLLCANCNLGLGHFRDDRELLRRAITYLGVAETGHALDVWQREIVEEIEALCRP